MQEFFIAKSHTVGGVTINSTDNAIIYRLIIPGPLFCPALSILFVEGLLTFFSHENLDRVTLKSSCE